MKKLIILLTTKHKKSFDLTLLFRINRFNHLKAGHGGSFGYK